MGRGGAANRFEKASQAAATKISYPLLPRGVHYLVAEARRAIMHIQKPQPASTTTGASGLPKECRRLSPCGSRHNCSSHRPDGPSRWLPVGQARRVGKLVRKGGDIR